MRSKVSFLIFSLQSWDFLFAAVLRMSFQLLSCSVVWFLNQSCIVQFFLSSKPSRIVRMSPSIMFHGVSSPGGFLCFFVHEVLGLSLFLRNTSVIVTLPTRSSTFSGSTRFQLSPAISSLSSESMFHSHRLTHSIQRSSPVAPEVPDSFLRWRPIFPGGCVPLSPSSCARRRLPDV